MASKIVNCRVEPELYAALRAQCRDQKVRWSEYLRVLLRHGAGVCDLRESGYREGKFAGYAEVRGKLDSAFNELPATLERATTKK